MDSTSLTTSLWYLDGLRGSASLRENIMEERLETSFISSTRGFFDDDPSFFGMVLDLVLEDAACLGLCGRGPGVIPLGWRW